MDEERFRGTVEDAIYEFPEHAAKDVVLGVRGAVNERAVLAALFQIALGFEDFHHGHNGGIGDFAVLEERLIDIADGGALALPDQLHDFQFLRGECGVSGGVPGGVGSGVAGGVSGSASRDIPTVDGTTIWTDTVKRGPMLRQVRGLGALVRAEDSGNLIARITLPEVMTQDVRANQNATVDTKKGLVKGHVSRLSSSTSNETRGVDIAFDAALPEGASVDLQIDATIDIERLDNILYVGRPVHATANSTASLFKLVKGGMEAVRVNVKLGRSSVNTIEVLDGLREGDKVILSDMSTYDDADRVRINLQSVPRSE